MKIITIDDELLDLVNEHDQIIGQEWRSVVHEQGLRNFRVVNAFLINQQSQLWIPRRTAHKKLFPSALDASMGGHVASGETYEQAFSRELMEELRIDATRNAYEKIGALNPHQHNTSGFMQVYVLRTNSVPQFNPDDFVEYYWLTPHEFLQRVEQGDSCKSDLPKIIRHLFI
ncbi:MAG: Nudix hydrolase [Candidatus Dependentiae bacterium ADurb.Bin331]|nr:MAG: Nudix hydrolase [Candidatus Dependentiae bacterium ADurb.Bin331]